MNPAVARVQRPYSRPGSHGKESDLATVGSDPGLDRYFDHARAVPLLTPNQELALAKRIAVGRQASQQLVAGAPDSDGSLAGAAAAGHAAFAWFVTANLRLVAATASRFAAQSGVEAADLLQEGNIGLLRAVERYDWRSGYRFSTYAMFWIRDAVQRGAARQERTVRLPHALHDGLVRIRAAQARLEAESDRVPSLDELAAATNLPVVIVQRCLAHDQRFVSLDRLVGHDPDSEALHAFVPASDDTEEEVVEMIFTQQLRAAVRSLDDRARQVVVRRFGLDGHDPMSITAVARDLHLHRNTVHNLLRTAVAQLRDDLQVHAA